MFKITLGKMTATTTTMTKALEAKYRFEELYKGEAAIIEEVITSTDIYKMLVDGITKNNNALIAKAIIEVANGVKAPFVSNKKLGMEVAYFQYCKEVIEASTYEEATKIGGNGYAVKPWLYIHHPEVVRFSNTFYGIWKNQKDVDIDEVISRAELMLQETEALNAFNIGATTKVAEYWLKENYPEYQLLVSDFRIAGFNYIEKEEFDKATFGVAVEENGQELFRIQYNDKYRNVICKWSDGLYHRLKDLLIEDLVPEWVQRFLLEGAKDRWSDAQQALVYALNTEGVDKSWFCKELSEKFTRVRDSFVKEKEEEHLRYGGFKVGSEELAKTILRMANAKEPDRLEAQIQINLEKAPIKKVLEALKRAIEAEKVSASAEGLKKQTCFVINQLKKADVYSVAVHADRIIKQREEEDAAIEAALASRL